jgi:hypothetical protein
LLQFSLKFQRIEPLLNQRGREGETESSVALIRLPLVATLGLEIGIRDDKPHDLNNEIRATTFSVLFRKKKNLRA